LERFCETDVPLCEDEAYPDYNPDHPSKVPLIKKYPQVFLSVTFSKEYMVNALSGDRFEIESYKEIYPAKLEPNRTLCDPERNKIPA